MRDVHAKKTCEPRAVVVQPAAGVQQRRLRGGGNAAPVGMSRAACGGVCDKARAACDKSRATLIAERQVEQEKKDVVQAKRPRKLIHIPRKTIRKKKDVVQAKRPRKLIQIPGCWNAGCRAWNRLPGCNCHPRPVVLDVDVPGKCGVAPLANDLRLCKCRSKTECVCRDRDPGCGAHCPPPQVPDTSCTGPPPPPSEVCGQQSHRANDASKDETAVRVRVVAPCDAAAVQSVKSHADDGTKTALTNQSSWSTMTALHGTKTVAMSKIGTKLMRLRDAVVAKLDRLKNDAISDKDKCWLRANYEYIVEQLTTISNDVIRRSPPDDEINSLICKLRAHEMYFKLYCKQHEQLRVKYKKQEKGFLGCLWSCMTLGCC